AIGNAVEHASPRLRPSGDSARQATAHPRRLSMRYVDYGYQIVTGRDPVSFGFDGRRLDRQSRRVIECCTDGVIMKLYDGGRAPNPRRVRIFLAEKGIDVPVEPVDL